MSGPTLAASVRHLRVRLAAQRDFNDSDEYLLDAFTERRDETAFAVLVRRHGPMVLSVCRRVLGHHQDAEDAFQAVFLVLARNANKLRKKTALVAFLHGTAYRMALSAKRSAGRRRKHEGRFRRAERDDHTNSSDGMMWREVHTLLDEEIADLPEVYRSVFILCCLENVSREEAGRRLGVKLGTVSSRLAEARKRLQQRLTRRGVALAALLAATALTTETAAALPLGLLTKTIEGAASPAVAALVESGSSILGIGRMKLAALVLTMSMLAGAGLLACRPAAPFASPQPAAKEKADQSKPPTPIQDKTPTVRISGRVLDPDGKPVRGAKLLFLYNSAKAQPKKVWAVSAADGRFRFSVPKNLVSNPYSETLWQDTQVMAAAEGYGFALSWLGKAESAELTLRLVKDDVPIRGRVLNLEGKPVAGVRVRIDGSLFVPEKGDLTAWLAALKDEKRDRNLVWWAHLTQLGSSSFDVLFPPVTTGADGRFRFNGIGRERVASLRIEGPTIAMQEITAMTRTSEKIVLPEDRDHPKAGTVTYYGAAFDLVAVPVRPVVGVVRDKDTGKPLAGVTIETELIADKFGLGRLRTTTDKEGRYRLMGLAKSNGHTIAATTSDRPYLYAIRIVDNTPGVEAVTVNFALKRGVWVTGHVTDKTTNKSVSANVVYFCFDDNPNANEIARQGSYYNQRSTADDGSFRIAVLPGRGLIAVRAYRDHYVMGVGAAQIKDPDPERQPGIFSTVPYRCLATNFHTVAEITPELGDKSLVCNVTLDPGRSLKGKVLGPDGKALAGARVSGLKDMGYWLNTGADFTVESLRPNAPRMLQFVHEGKKLVGTLILNGDEKDPVSVRLEPFGTLTGRLVTPQGDPIAGASVTCGAVVKWHGRNLHPTALDTRTDKEGRFRIVGLKPGLKYDLGVTKDAYLREIVGGEPKHLTVESGRTKDLGDLRVKPRE